MRTRQRGVTLIGWVVLLTPLAIVGYAAIRLTPVYLNYMNVVRSLEQVAGEFKEGGDAAAIRNSLEKHFDVESIDYPTIKDIKITKDGRGWQVQAAYDDQAPLFSNVFILVAFDKSVHVGGPAGD